MPLTFKGKRLCVLITQPISGNRSCHNDKNTQTLYYSTYRGFSLND